MCGYREPLSRLIDEVLDDLGKVVPNIEERRDELVNLVLAQVNVFNMSLTKKEQVEEVIKLVLEFVKG